MRPIVPSPEEWGYRNKMEFSFFSEEGKVSLGLHRKGAFDRYFKVPPCLIADPDFIPLTEAVIAFAQESGLSVYDKRSHAGFFRHLVLRKGKRTGQVLVNLVTASHQGVDAGFFAPLVERTKDRVSSFYWTVNDRVSDAVAVDRLTLLCGTETIEERLQVRGREYRFVISPFSFFQTNSLGAEQLYGHAVDALEPQPDDDVLDLYCGTGSIGIAIAPYVRSVFGVEQVASAIENAEINRKMNGIDNIRFACGSVEKWVKQDDIPGASAVMVDPPRGGLTEKVISFMLRIAPRKIVYVSCNPATLARDLALITGQGKYAVKSLLPVDMFPHTYHVEAVASLRRLDSPSS
jgi:23S rRNA (uracil-5-)-methyltransferase RumA